MAYFSQNVVARCEKIFEIFLTIHHRKESPSSSRVRRSLPTSMTRNFIRFFYFLRHTFGNAILASNIQNFVHVSVAGMSSDSQRFASQTTATILCYHLVPFISIIFSLHSTECLLLVSRCARASYLSFSNSSICCHHCTKRTKLQQRQPSSMQNWDSDRPSVTAQRVSVRLSQENLYIALLLLHGSYVVGSITEYKTPIPPHLDWHYLFTFLFRKVHPNGIRCLSTRHHTVCGVLCDCKRRLDGIISVVFDAIFFSSFFF